MGVGRILASCIRVRGNIDWVCTGIDDDFDGPVRLQNDTWEIGGGNQRFYKNIFSVVCWTGWMQNWKKNRTEVENFGKCGFNFVSILIYVERIS